MTAAKIAPVCAIDHAIISLPRTIFSAVLFAFFDAESERGNKQSYETEQY